MAVDIAKRKRTSSSLKSWLEDVSHYEREFKKWEGRSEKIQKRYKDEGRETRDSSSSRFNILWANVQTLCAATFSKIPKPDVSRRFLDNDPIGRVASLILERGLDFHIQHYSDYRSALKGGVLDRFLGGRATVWVRYEPHFRNPQESDGAQITEDVEIQEELDYECAAVDYVHWKDFGHCVARTWEEVPRVWRKVYMTKAMVEERFGKDIAKLVSYDNSENTGDNYKAGDPKDKAIIYEGWDKEEKTAVWFNKGVKDLLDERDDPLGLEEFFPCPRPMFATLTNDSLVPVPDFTLYQDQANDLDVLADRINGLTKALQVKGVYDAALGVEIARIFTEGENGTLIPVKNWQAFAEKNGLKGSVDLFDILPIAKALSEAYRAFEQVKGQIHEITGIADIVRGQTDPNETLGAQQIKGQYASLRLKTYQEEVARYATEILQIMAQVICKKFDPKTILSQAAADQLSDSDKQYIMPAMQLLIGQRVMNPDMEEGPNPLRSFRVEVNADTLVYLDEQAEKQSAVEFMDAVGSYLEKAGALLVQLPQQAQAPIIRLLMEMMKFGVSRFKVGKGLEGTFDETAEQLVKVAMIPPPPRPPSPQLQVAQIKAQSEQQVAPIRAQAETIRAQADIAGAQADVQVAAHKVRQTALQSAMPPTFQ